MSRLPLDLNHFGTNTINGTMSPIESITVRVKVTYPAPLTLLTNSAIRQTDSLEQKGKEQVPTDAESDPSSSDSLSSKYDLLDDTNCSKYRGNKSDKNKKRQEHKKQDSLLGKLY